MLDSTPPVNSSRYTMVVFETKTRSGQSESAVIKDEGGKEERSANNELSFSEDGVLEIIMIITTTLPFAAGLHL